MIDLDSGEDGRWGEDFIFGCQQTVVLVHLSSWSHSAPDHSSPHIRCPPYPTISQQEKSVQEKCSPSLYEETTSPSTSLLLLYCAFLNSWKCKNTSKATSSVFAIQKESSLHLSGAVRSRESF